MKNLPFTIVYDRSLYGGGLTFASIIEDLFLDIGGFYGNYSFRDLNSIRCVDFSPENNRFGTRQIREETVNFLWGLSMRQRMSPWPKPTKYIATLRHPILRFISLVRSVDHYKNWNSFWENDLWNGQSSMNFLEFFVDQYLTKRTEWSRSQFSELMGRVDYAGLEWTIAPSIYADDSDPLLEEGGVEKTIQWMEKNFEDIYILELQEECAVHFAIKY
jgi:hypothetical protein